jgi:hypothetical protein
MDVQVRQNDMAVYGQHYKFIEPIPLTEEWLLRFGFIRDNKEILSLKENENEFIFFLEGNHVIIDKQQGQQLSGISIDCEYVHQLQNLYFALTGKELESTQIEKI